MTKFQIPNRWKAVAVLCVFALVLMLLFFGPVLRQPPDPGPPVDVPAMTNVPPAGSLTLETP